LSSTMRPKNPAASTAAKITTAITFFMMCTVKQLNPTSANPVCLAQIRNERTSIW
jgi:hypothetical protein